MYLQTALSQLQRQQELSVLQMAPWHILYWPQCSGCMHSQFPAESDKVETCININSHVRTTDGNLLKKVITTIKNIDWKSCQGRMNDSPFLFIPISKGKTGLRVKELTLPHPQPLFLKDSLSSYFRVRSFGWSVSGSLIQDRSDHGASKEPVNPLW